MEILTVATCLLFAFSFLPSRRQTTAPESKEHLIGNLNSVFFCDNFWVFKTTLLTYTLYIIKLTHFGCTIQWFLVLYQVAQASQWISFRTFSHVPPIRSVMPSTVNLSSHLRPVATANLLSVAISLPLLNILDRWNPTRGSLLCPISFA